MMSYWTQRRRINATVERQLVELLRVDQDHYEPDVNSLSELDCDMITTSACFADSDNISLNSLSTGTPNIPEQVEVPNNNCSDSLDYLDEVTEDEYELFCIDSEDTKDDDELDIVTELAQWGVKNSITLSAMSELLQILRPCCPELPKDPRTLMKTATDLKQDDKMILVSNGAYYHFGIASNIVQQVHSAGKIESVKKVGAVSFQLNIDGVPVFKSTNGQFWPVLGKVDKPFVGRPFVVGLYYGVTKPSNLDFLNGFCNEYAEIRRCGICLDNIVLRCNISVVICDAPARAMIKCVKGHTSYSSCERCIQTGVWAGKMTFPDLKAARRTDESFYQMSDGEHHSGVSPLSSDQLGIGMVSEFVLDYMHLICLGVVRRLIWIWLCGPLKLHCRLTASKVSELSDVLLNFRCFIPKEFARKTRSLFEWQRWKATEFRQLLLYTGPVAFAGKLSEIVYKNFLLLSVGVYLLLDDDSDADTIDYAEELLVAFVEHYCDLYGSDMVVYNVHNVIHLADDARKFGSLDKVSAFCFENFLGKLVKLIRKPNQPFQQLVRRLLERKEFGMQDYVSNTSDANSIELGGEHHNGYVPAGIGLCKQFKSILVNGVHIAISTGNNCITLGNNIAVVRNILKTDVDIFFVYQTFHEFHDFYTYPLHSSKIGIYLVSQLNSELFIARLCDFKKKNVMLPFKDSFVVIPLLNF